MLNRSVNISKSDIWSCGAIMHTLLVGFPPFYGLTKQEIFEELENEEMNFDGPLWENISDSAKSLLKQLLEIKPDKRISAAEALKSTWFVKVSPLKEVNEINSKNIKLYLRQSTLQRALLIYISSNNSMSKSADNVREMFDFMDIDGDGEISQKELVRGYKGIYSNLARAKKEADYMLKNLGNSDATQIDFDGNLFFKLSRFSCGKSSSTKCFKAGKNKRSIQHIY